MQAAPLAEVVIINWDSILPLGAFSNVASLPADSGLHGECSMVTTHALQTEILQKKVQTSSEAEFLCLRKNSSCGRVWQNTETQTTSNLPDSPLLLT